MISSYKQRYKAWLSVLMCFIQHCTKIFSQKKEVSYLIGEKRDKVISICISNEFTYTSSKGIHFKKNLLALIRKFNEIPG